MIGRSEFEVLTYIEKQGFTGSVRNMADELCISGSIVSEALESLEKQGFAAGPQTDVKITEKGLEALEPFRVKRAVILAAGFGKRMMPATKDRPKPMVTVNGVRIIDTLLDALVAAGIREITIVGGYCFEKLSELLDKYPFLDLIENKDYAVTNNISSAVLASGKISGGCYLCEADLYISSPKSVITKYQYASNILGSWSLQTDDWSFDMKEGLLSDYKKGGTYRYNYYGISYWTAQDCEKLARDFKEVFALPDGRDLFWEFIPFILKKEDYNVEIRPCRKQDIMEIDNYYELAQLDPSYLKEEQQL